VDEAVEYIYQNAIKPNTLAVKSEKWKVKN
jgi:hypothetical protein